MTREAVEDKLVDGRDRRARGDRRDGNGVQPAFPAGPPRHQLRVGSGTRAGGAGQRPAREQNGADHRRHAEQHLLDGGSSTRTSTSKSGGHPSSQPPRADEGAARRQGAPSTRADGATRTSTRRCSRRAARTSSSSTQDGGAACPYCAETKRLLVHKGAPYGVVELDLRRRSTTAPRCRARSRRARASRRWCRARAARRARRWRLERQYDVGAGDGARLPRRDCSPARPTRRGGGDGERRRGRIAPAAPTVLHSAGNLGRSTALMLATAAARSRRRSTSRSGHDALGRPTRAAPPDGGGVAAAAGGAAVGQADDGRLLRAVVRELPRHGAVDGRTRRPSSGRRGRVNFVVVNGDDARNAQRRPAGARASSRAMMAHDAQAAAGRRRRRRGAPSATRRLRRKWKENPTGIYGAQADVAAPPRRRATFSRTVMLHSQESEVCGEARDDGGGGRGRGRRAEAPAFVVELHKELGSATRAASSRRCPPNRAAHAEVAASPRCAPTLGRHASSTSQLLPARARGRTAAART